MKQDHHVTHLLSYANTVLWCSHCKIHRCIQFAVFPINLSSFVHHWSMRIIKEIYCSVGVPYYKKNRLIFSQYWSETEICFLNVSSMFKRNKNAHRPLLNNRHLNHTLFFIIIHLWCSARDWEWSGLLEGNPQSGCTEICASIKGPL